MTRAPRVAQRAERLLGSAVVATAEVAGGDTCRATKLRLSDGTTALMKTAPRVPDGFFAAEAAGLRWLAAAPEGAAPVPEVLAVDEECLVVRWVEPARPSPEAAIAFGRALAHTHLAGADGFGAERDGFIGRLPLPQRPAGSWAEFYAVRRVLPYLKLARDRGAIEEEQARAIESVVGRLPRLVPDEPPARLHGDLWNGNVVWGAGSPGEPAQGWLVDPAAYGGHREVDLAMLALFGLPHLPQVLEAYESVHPLADGWQDRVALHQLFPLLVHAALFGGGYGPRAADLARRYV